MAATVAYRAGLGRTRTCLELLVEVAIATLDAIDGDPDFESDAEGEPDDDEA